MTKLTLTESNLWQDVIVKLQSGRCTGGYAKRVGGDACGPNDKDVVSHCVVGAIMAVQGFGSYDSPMMHLMFRRLREYFATEFKSTKDKDFVVWLDKKKDKDVFFHLERVMLNLPYESPAGHVVANTPSARHKAALVDYI